jgi:hypothetical protein
MAKKKGRGRSRGYRGKKRAPSRKSKATPLGVTAGGAYGGMNALFVPAAGTSGSMFDALKALNFPMAAKRVPYVVKDKDVYMPILGGLLVSAAPSLPLIKLVAKPMDRAVRKATKGKVSL